jgi:hypothetical protein
LRNFAANYEEISNNDDILPAACHGLREELQRDETRGGPEPA